MSFHAPFVERYQALPAWSQRPVMMLVTLLVGWIVLALLRRYAVAGMKHSRFIDRTLQSFLRKLITSGGWVVLFVILLTQAGVDLGALLGGLAIGGFVLGFALKDTLGNLAAGVMLLFYRPFNVGEVVSLHGMDGEVTSLGMALTTLRMADGRIATIPNGSVLGGNIINHTRLEQRRADVSVGISYDDDIDTAVRAILEAVQQDSRVLAEPAPQVRITALGASSVDLQVRPWVQTADIWEAKADLHATVKRALEAAGCSIPYPQQDVHLHNAA